MSIADLATLPDSARLWIFGADRPLEDRERETLGAHLRRFLTEWTAHGHELVAGFAVHESRFLLIGLDEGHGSASGCSIDGLVRRLRDLELQLGIALLDGEAVWYRDAEGQTQRVDRTEFRRRAAQGAIHDQTPVFDLTISTLGQFRSDRWEVPASASWHARLLERRGSDPVDHPA